MSEINPLSQNTYYKSLKTLNELGLIKWEKGKHNVSNLKVTIIKFKVSVNNSIDTSIKVSIDNSIEVSIGNNNKTIDTIKPSKQSKTKVLDFSVFTEKESAIIKLYADYRTEIKKPLSQKAIDILKQEINTKGLTTIEAQINQSIKNGWTGLFEVKNNGFANNDDKYKPSGQDVINNPNRLNFR